MLVRIKPISDTTDDYLKLLIANIDQEFEHNLVQQIYISDESWTAIVATKNGIINKLKHVAEKSKTASELRETVLIDYTAKLPPTETAIAFIKNEVKKYYNNNNKDHLLRWSFSFFFITTFPN
ncbi:hypothetical protein [Polaribacter ponticola]|uniref:Uncharacterized protein n=1 Tax=Polaribacter ponticola TaxID=2978475 RepID=A0ABT5S8M9_9FLAO|nr:hypothetical protein [Polaribacter sp. MSW5]MDD7914179.1 hypothetical protein [Polaribacter sp. MSW5]